MAETTDSAKAALSKTLLGKDVKALLDMPAYKDGVDIYVYPKSDKRLDERGIDLKDLAKYLKDKGVGVERDEWVTITDVKIDSDRVEVHLGGGGEGSGASKNAEKKGAGFKRAGGSRINFRYGRDLTDVDIQGDAFLPLLQRVLDTSKIRDTRAGCINVARSATNHPSGAKAQILCALAARLKPCPFKTSFMQPVLELVA